MFTSNFVTTLRRTVNKVFGSLGLRLVPKVEFDHLCRVANPSSLDLATKFGLEIKSVLHIGSHSGDEAQDYSARGITYGVFIEANPEVFQRLQRNLVGFENFYGINACLSDKEENVSFHLSSNDGASSSILLPKRHLVERPDINFPKTIYLSTKTLDSFSLGGFDLIVIDVQGAEGKVIEGGWFTILQAKALYLECNVGEMYETDISIFGLHELLYKHFDLVYVEMGPNLWGDSFFVRKRF